MKLSTSSLVIALAFVISLVAVQHFQAQQRQLHIGKWTLNLGKSKFSGQAPKEQTQQYESQGNATKVTVVGVDANGNRVAYGYTFTPDGKAYPIVAAMPNGADTVEVKNVDPKTIETTFKKDGKVIETTRTETSPDGKQLTITSTKFDPSGQPMKAVMVFDRA
jgi:uncharacterized protein (UPF0128 family)